MGSTCRPDQEQLDLIRSLVLKEITRASVSNTQIPFFFSREVEREGKTERQRRRRKAQWNMTSYFDTEASLLWGPERTLLMCLALAV